MTHEQETALHNFEALVRQLMMAHEEEKRKSAQLEQELEACRQQLAEARKAHAQSVEAYQYLKTARMLEVSGDDVKESRARLARLIREVDKCIALLDV